MPLRYWRTSACVLALGIGGLAVCAEECIRGGAPAAKETKRAKADSKTEPALAAAPPANGIATPPPLPAVPGRAVSAAKPATLTGQYKLYLRMGGNGQPRFEIRDGDQLLLKVTCEQIELHGAQDGKSALPGLTASGNVKLHGSGLDGTCDQLSITAVKGEVALKGAVKLTCYRGTMSSQVVAESVMFQLARTGETAATKMKAA